MSEEREMYVQGISDTFSYLVNKGILDSDCAIHELVNMIKLDNLKHGNFEEKESQSDRLVQPTFMAGCRLFYENYSEASDYFKALIDEVRARYGQC